jgi:hypothetical protein
MKAAEPLEEGSADINANDLIAFGTAQLSERPADIA